MECNVKLKDPGTCRIFFSSPFGGMEEEREELTKNYFPQIHHACNAKGIKFVPVDMRWGITKEAADNAQVMNICLREVARSDFFVGFFGQRYGWHSAHSDDSILLENFDKAMDLYPWVEKFKGRSMTEIEFRAGHLNQPGAMPACFCFRDKEFDDYMKEEGLKNQDQSQVMKFTIENQYADKMRSGLIQELVDTQDKTWGVKLECKNPQEMAKFMFDTLWKFLTEAVLVDLVDEVPYLVQQRLLHDQFITSSSLIYCGCEEYLDQLTSKITGPPTKGTVVTGPAGCGKSALLAKWIQLVQQAHPYITVIYHFIGCAPGTEVPRKILERILLELRESFPSLKSKTPAPENSNANNDNESEADKNPDKGDKKISETTTNKDNDDAKNEGEKDENSNKKDVDDQNKTSTEENATQDSTSSADEKIFPDVDLIQDDKIATNLYIVPPMVSDAKEEDKIISSGETEKNTTDQDESTSKEKKAEDETSTGDKTSSGEDKTSSGDSKSRDSKSSDNSSTPLDKDKTDSDQKEESKEKKSGLEKKSTQQILSEMSLLMQRITEEGHKVVVILDAFNQQKSQDKNVKHMYWLPEVFPDGIIFVCSTLDTDTASQDVLIEQKGMDNLVIQPFDSQLQEKICVETLKLAGKELSPHQLERVINAKETSNALFLKLVLYELSIYGSFNKLDSKIDSLIYVSGVKPLLQVILERLEVDYCPEEYEGNLVKDALCCLIASRKGLTETELTEILNVSAHLWSPLFFAFEHLLSQYTGLLGFAFSEMREAVVERYLHGNDQLVEYKKKLINYYNSIRKTMRPWIKTTKPEHSRLVEELPWLQIDIRQTEGLIETLSDLSILRKIAANSVNDLLYLWQQTNLPWSAVSNIYMTAYDKAVSDLYLEFQDGVFDEKESPGMKIRATLQYMRIFFDAAYYSRGCQAAMEREIRVLETCKSTLAEEKRAEYLRDSRYYLAVSYSEQQDVNKALTLYTAIQEECQKLMKDGTNIKEEIKEMQAFTCNGLGLVYYYKKNNVKAREYLTLSKKLHKEMKNKMHEGASATNIGLTYLDDKSFNKALECFHDAMQLYEDYYFGKISTDMGNLYTNMALTYRRMKNLDKAEEFYHKSLEMKAMNVGWNHPIIATAFMNLGTLEVHRKNYKKSEEWTRKAIHIYETNEYPVTDRTHRMCRENLCVNMLKQNKKNEVLPMYIDITHILVDNGWVDELIVSLHVTMLEMMLDKEMYDDVEKFVLAILASSKRRAKFAKILADLDSRRPPTVPRPPELTLQAFMKEYPKEDLLVVLHVAELAKANNLEELITVCHGLHDRNVNLKESAYSLPCSDLRKAKFYDTALRILEIGLEKYPNHMELVHETLKCLMELKRMDDVAGYVPLLLTLENWTDIDAKDLLNIGDALRDSHKLEAGKLFYKLVIGSSIINLAQIRLDEMYPDGLPFEIKNSIKDDLQSTEGSKENPETDATQEKNTTGVESTPPSDTVSGKHEDDQKTLSLGHQNEDTGQNPATQSENVLAQNEDGQKRLFIAHQSMDANQNQGIPPENVLAQNEDGPKPLFQAHQSMDANQNQGIPPENVLAQNGDDLKTLLQAHQSMDANQNQGIPPENVLAQNGDDLKTLLQAHQSMDANQNQGIPPENVLAQNGDDLKTLLQAHQSMDANQNQGIPPENVLAQNEEDLQTLVQAHQSMDAN